MNLATAIVLGVIVAAVVAAIAAPRRRKGGGCNCGCAGCAMRDHCGK